MSLGFESLLVAIGGALGAVVRLLFGKLGMAFVAGYMFGVPILTTVVNVVGCFAAGMALALLARQGMLESGMRSFLVVGFLGGFTTFSAFGVESLAVLHERGVRVFVFFVSINIFASLSALAIGRYLGLGIRS